MTAAPTALVVDDEPQMTAIVEFALSTQGFTVLVAHDGATALGLLRGRTVDLVVLDVLMPTLDGLTLCQLIRRRSDVPIMMLTALTQHEDIIAGLEHGADDYVTKPFHPREVALRAQALVRRRREGAGVSRVADLVVDADARAATLSGHRLDLPDIEFRLLAQLAGHPDIVQPWRRLLSEVWGAPPDVVGGRDMVKATVYRLRSHLSAVPGGAAYVQTVRGSGYVMPREPAGPVADPLPEA
jgi:DNA-binding response OmpR family regulator